ncbi:MAG: alpha/beta fold hydrolase [Alphaproteobacteria bacterium]|nr:alpha/beta fold hydrolase [Alphaproteobacteria bacterium]
MQTIVHETNFGPVALTEVGAGGVLIVLLHAAAAGPHALVDLAKLLAAAGRRVWLPALAGYDATGPGADLDPVAAHVRVAGWVLDAARADATVERVVLVGHSMGGLVAAKAAAGRDDLMALILCEPIVLATLARDDPALIRDAALIDALDAGVASGNPEPAVAAFVAAWNEIAWSALPAEVRQRLAAGAARLARETRSVNQDATPDAVWATITTRATVVHGDRSPALAATMAQNLVERLPRATRVTLPRLGHMAPVLAPERVAALIERATARAC